VDEEINADEMERGFIREFLTLIFFRNVELLVLVRIWQGSHVKCDCKFFANWKQIF